MLMQRIAGAMLGASLLIAGTGLACAQDYPHKPIRIVTGGAGGGTDQASRLIAQGMSGNLGISVLVDNRSGILGSELVAKSSGDGYTIMLSGSNLWLAPCLQDKVPYDPVADFSPITLAVSAPNILVVHPSVPAHSVKELISLAKARPGVLNYASVGTGGSNHIAAELFKSLSGVDMVRISYKAGGIAFGELIAGQVQVMFATMGGSTQYVKAGRLRALAVTTAQPSPLVPGLATVANSGLPGYEAATIQGIFAPVKTPAAIINTLNQEIVRVLNKPDIREKFNNVGVETVGSSATLLAATVKSEMTRLGKVIQAARIRAD